MLAENELPLFERPADVTVFLLLYACLWLNIHSSNLTMFGLYEFVFGWSNWVCILYVYIYALY